MKMVVVTPSGELVARLRVTNNGVHSNDDLPEGVESIVDSANRLQSIAASDPAPDVLPEKPVGVGDGKVESSAAEKHTKATESSRQKHIQRAFSQRDEFAIPESELPPEHPVREEITPNATRYSEGDEVSTPQGVGVVADVLTEAVETDEDTIEADDSSPTYVVVVEDGRVGYETYKAEAIHSTTIETDVDDPEGAMADEEETANALGRVIDLLTPSLSANDFDVPPSWRKSSTPNRVIALKALASMNADFDKCTREMSGEVASPDRYCGAFFDYAIGNPYWRGDSILPGD